MPLGQNPRCKVVSLLRTHPRQPVAAASPARHELSSALPRPPSPAALLAAVGLAPGPPQCSLCGCNRPSPYDRRVLGNLLLGVRRPVTCVLTGRALQRVSLDDGRLSEQTLLTVCLYKMPVVSGALLAPEQGKPGEGARCCCTGAERAMRGAVGAL